MARDVIALRNSGNLPLLHDLSCALTLPELAAYLRMLNCYVSMTPARCILHGRSILSYGFVWADGARELGFFRAAIPPRFLRFP